MYCWSFAYSRIQSSSVYHAVATDALRPERLVELAPRDVANITWAFARTQIKHAALFGALASHSKELIEDSLTQSCYCGTHKSLWRAVYARDTSAVGGRVDAFDMISMGTVDGKKYSLLQENRKGCRGQPISQGWPVLHFRGGELASLLGMARGPRIMPVALFWRRRLV